MSQFRKIQLDISQSLLDEVNNAAIEQDLKIDDIVRKALKTYLRNFQKLKAGYEEMAEINEEYAEMCLNADNEALTACEEKLSESE